MTEPLAAPKDVYDFEAEAKRLIEAIEPRRGATMTVLCALHEAFNAGARLRDHELQELQVALTRCHEETSI